MAKRKKQDSTTARPSAQKLLQDFLKENQITFDYQVVNEKVIPVDDGFIVKPNTPILKVIPRYE